MTLIKQIFADLSNCKSTKYNQWSSHLRHLRAILYFDTLSPKSGHESITGLRPVCRQVCPRCAEAVPVVLASSLSNGHTARQSESSSSSCRAFQLVSFASRPVPKNRWGASPSVDGNRPRPSAVENFLRHRQEDAFRPGAASSGRFQDGQNELSAVPFAL